MTATTRKDLKFMIERFPEHRTQILEMYCNNEYFRTLCENYLLTSMQLKKFMQGSTADTNKGHAVNVYTIICKELENEVLTLLTKKNNRSKDLL